MNMKLLALFILSVTIFTACSDRDDNVLASGVFETTEVIVSSESIGKILQFPISEGDIVEQGEFLAKIDSIQLELKRELLLKGIETAERRRPSISIQLAPIEQQILTAKKEKGRVENLLKAGATNEKQFDDIQAQIFLLEKQLTAQKTSLENSNLIISREIESLEIQVKQITDQIERCKVTSPLSGTVLVKYAETGEFTAAGKALVKIANTSEMYLLAYITSAQLSMMKTGQIVEVLADFGDKENRIYEGTVVWISDEAEFTPKTVQTRDERSNLVYAVKISVKNDGFLKIGMYGGIRSDYE